MAKDRDRGGDPDPMYQEEIKNETVTAQRRRRTPEVRRDQIIQAAVKLFAEHGYERTTTREIAQEAGISEGTIYNYFGSKQDLLFAFLEEASLQPLASLMTALEGVDDEQVIRGFLEDRLSLAERHLPLMKVIFGEALFNSELAEALCHKIVRPATEIVEGFMARRMQEGGLRDMNPTIAARALIGHFFSFGLLWDALLSREGKRFSRQEVVESLTSLFLEGIRNKTNHISRKEYEP
jgi:AcrR family transcriptional regulator